MLDISKPVIHLHLGAHKTATTFIQNELVRLLMMKSSQMSASTDGGPSVSIIPLRDLRENFSVPFNAAFMAGGIYGVRMIRRWLFRKLMETNRRINGEQKRIIVVSDEMLLGSLDHIVAGRSLYAEARGRITALLDIFAGYQVNVFLTIRSYASFYPSAFVQVLSRKPKTSFDRFLKVADFEGRGWREVVSDLESVVGRERLTVCHYEEYSQNFAPVLNALAPGLGFTTADIQNTRPALVSLSAKAVECLDRLDGLLTSGETKRMIKLLRDFEFEAPNPKLALLDESLVFRLQARYKQDLAFLNERGHAH